MDKGPKNPSSPGEPTAPKAAGSGDSATPESSRSPKSPGHLKKPPPHMTMAEFAKEEGLDKTNIRLAVLVSLIEVGQYTHKEVVNTVLQLVSHTFIQLLILNVSLCFFFLNSNHRQ